ncbi:MAG: phosphate transport system regulatory protein PhoU [Chloroflexi bacterium]|nr:MAG: phosphate transport system regulatory protein PhoU [Chloroflexota bacterium]MBL1197170.1 phosphate transport system regulatory protein PhoU [Chloroflexota bacterium]NOH14464.1 phosphate signaling complex protein PhoU [Chloroflexota bacterium]
MGTRLELDRQIEELRDEVIILGSMVEQATLDAVASLLNRDLAESKRVYLEDEKINKKRFDIENRTLICIATQHPLATDLRVLASILEVITELERMGDYAKGIARININLGEEHPLKPPHELDEMSRLATDMLHRSLEAFVTVDKKAAKKIPKEDDKIDELYKRVERSLLDKMIADSNIVDKANHLNWAAHNLERLADRVTNICERTRFMATGKLKEMDDSDDEFDQLLLSSN